MVEYGLLAAFLAGGVLSGSSYITHDASAGENVLLGVFKPSVSSKGARSNSASRKKVLVTE